jgi:hypothetical protein
MGLGADARPGVALDAKTGTTQNVAALRNRQVPPKSKTPLEAGLS